MLFNPNNKFVFKNKPFIWNLKLETKTLSLPLYFLNPKQK